MMRRGLRIKPAGSPLEVRQMVEIRQRVHGDGGVDLFDALSTSTYLLALADEQVQGGIRITVDSPAGLPSDGHYNARPLLPAHAVLAHCSRICLDLEGPLGQRLLHGLFSMAGHWAHCRRLTHLSVLASASHAPSLQRVGFVPVASATDSPGGPIHPMVLDLQSPSWEFADFLRRQEGGLWTDSFERAFFDSGETVVVDGETGDEAYLVLDGKVRAIATDGSTVLASFGHGDMFGELALLTDLPRTATLVAAVPSDLMVLPREMFRRQVADSPEIAVRLLESVGRRFGSLIRAQKS